jgi:hypothetical protein
MPTYVEHILTPSQKLTLFSLLLYECTLLHLMHMFGRDLYKMCTSLLYYGTNSDPPSHCKRTTVSLMRRLFIISFINGHELIGSGLQIAPVTHMRDCNSALSRSQGTFVCTLLL